MTEEKTIDLHEAPASATAKVRTPNGFEWLITTRATTTNELLERVTFLDQEFIIKNWEVVAQRGGKFPDKPKHPDTGKIVEGKKCKNCGEPIMISSKGKEYCSAKCWL